MTTKECHCGSYYGCPLHCEKCKKELEPDIRPSMPPLCNSCYDLVFKDKDLEI